MKHINVDPDKARGDGRTVLVVDDNPKIRHAVSQAFLADGFSVCGEAANGKEAISLCNRLRPDIILLDLSMPVNEWLTGSTRTSQNCT